jgi:hypothetical protein
MSNDRQALEGAVAGLVFAILVVVGFVFVVPQPPDIDSSAATFASFYSDHQDALRVGFTILGIGLFFFIWFLGSLRSALAAAEGGTARLASIAFGAGLISAAVLMVGLAAGEAAAFRPGDVDPGVTRALSDVFVVIAAPGAAALTAFFAAIAVAGFRYRALPGWATWICVIAAIGQLPAFGAGVTQTGVFAGDGVLGLFTPIFTFLVGLVAVSIALMRSPAPRAASVPGTASVPGR